MGAMVSVTTVRMSPDLSIAKVYLSIFGGRIMTRYLKKFTHHLNLSDINLVKL